MTEKLGVRTVADLVRLAEKAGISTPVTSYRPCYALALWPTRQSHDNIDI